MSVVSKSIILLLLSLAILPETTLADKPAGILVIGDSLSSGYGLKAEQGWVQLLRDRLVLKGFKLPVRNASITGETTVGGLNRLPALLEEEKPAVVIIELGGNDGLRGFPLSRTRQNLAGMIEKSQASGARVLLLGVRLPVNYGSEFRTRFEAMYRQLGEDYAISLVPYLLKDIGEKLELMQGDGIHPSAEAQPIMLDNVWPSLDAILAADK
jgi:acyl-CoA thioesterase-1